MSYSLLPKELAPSAAYPPTTTSASPSNTSEFKWSGREETKLSPSLSLPLPPSYKPLHLSVFNIFLSFHFSTLFSSVFLSGDGRIRENEEGRNRYHGAIQVCQRSSFVVRWESFGYWSLRKQAQGGSGTNFISLHFLLMSISLVSSTSPLSSRILTFSWQNYRTLINMNNHRIL